MSETAITARAWFKSFHRVPDKATRQLRPIALYPEQQRVVAAWDAVDAEGLPVYPEVALLWQKKDGKSETCAGLGVCELIGNSHESDREIVLSASDFSQSKDVTFAAAKRIVHRHPWLREHVRVLASELVYTETVREPSGGSYPQDHILRAVPARDAKSLHGSNPTLVIFDEYWTQRDYDAVEALTSSATRRVTRVLYSSYAGLRVDMVAGNPLYDLWFKRWKEQQDPHLFVSFIGGPDGWKQVPWKTEALMQRERRRFAAVPQKFERLWLNQWATSDAASFLTAAELADAIDDTRTEATEGTPGVAYSIGIDLGLSHDFCALSLVHIDAVTSKLIVDRVDVWRGTKAQPVSLTEVEQAIVGLADRFRVSSCTLDAWQSALLGERLTRRGVRGVEVVQITAQKLDALATTLKTVFANRQIVLPRHRELIEQLETLELIERRRDLIRFQHTHGRHDDLPFALALALDGVADTVGRVTLPDTFDSCYRAQSVSTFSASSCFLLGGSYVPGGCPSCRACPGWQALKAARTRHLERGGEPAGYRDFLRDYVEPNDLQQRYAVESWANWNL